MKLIVALLVFTISSAQKIPDLRPQLGATPDLSLKAQAEFALRDSILNKLSAGVQESQLSQQEQLILRKRGEVYEDVWDIVGSACSWYCGGGQYQILASSHLKPQSGIDYKPENAGDLSYETAWVEGKPGYGIGEYLEYYFKNESPRITKIIIHNGYIKTDKAWLENSRVKKLKLSISGVPFAILNLADTKASQAFEITPQGRRPDGKDLILRFEILDVYKGTRYDDVAITEIYFDGIDVH